MDKDRPTRKVSSGKYVPSPKPSENPKDSHSLKKNICHTNDNILPKVPVKTPQDKGQSSDRPFNKKLDKFISLFQRKPGRPPSLRNFGANCYLNAAIQGISSCNKFVNEIVILHERRDLQWNGKLEKLLIFQKLINILHGGHHDTLEISRNTIFKNWNKPGQQDSYELLAYVINQVYNDIRKHLETEKLLSRNIQEWLKIPLPLRILIEYQIKCGCGIIIEPPLQSDLALHVPMSSTTCKDLQELVDDFFRNDLIEDYLCDSKDCDGKNARRYTKLRLPLPRTICIHLQRTLWNGYKLSKISQRIKFYERLIIKSQFCTMNPSDRNLDFNSIQGTKNQQCSENINNSEMSEIVNVEFDCKPSDFVPGNNGDAVKGKQISINKGEDDEDSNRKNSQLNSDKLEMNIDDSNLEKLIPESSSGKTSNVFENENRKDSNNETELTSDQPSIMDKDYALCSVIVHYGSIYGGHYVCYKLVNNQWFLTNDSSIQEVQASEVFKSEAYILFYEEL